MKYLGIIIMLLAVLLIVVYKFAVQSNILLALGVVLAFVGIVAHILCNKAAK
ncbi:MAG: hypothetical protein IJ581_00890 [Paludibacteraceae bacterium]|nr:hypothetical protein [Paludibacteraceae bacterium]